MKCVISYNGTMHGANAGVLDAHVRALHYGDGVFETLRARGVCSFRLDEHLERLCSGLKVLNIARPNKTKLKADVSEVLRANALAHARVKILAFRSGPPGPTPEPDREPCIVIIADPVDTESQRSCAEGVRARTVSIRRNTTSPLCSIKSLNYLDNIMARMEAAEHGDCEALFLNERGLVAECSTSNLFAVRGGQLLTPPLAAGALAGITRGVVFEIAGALKLPCAEWDLAPENLLGADELLLTNAGMGVMPLVMLDGHPIGQGAAGTVTARVQKAYNELFASETEPCE